MAFPSDIAPDLVADPNDPSIVDVESDEDTIERARAQRIEQLRTLGISKRAEYDRRKLGRSGQVQIWLEDMRAYNCEYDPETLEKIREVGGSAVYLSLIRSKTDAVEAHHSNLLFPTDEPNWDISPTPVPESSQLAGSPAHVDTTPQGQPVTAGDVALAVKKEADSACDRMQLEIADQLDESDYSGVGRRALHQGCVLGTCVIRGPTVKNKKARRWKAIQGSKVFEKTTVLDKRPAAEFVNVWDFFPSTGIAEIAQSEGFFVRHWLSRQQVKNLQFENDYLRDQIALILAEHAEAPKITDETVIQLMALTGEASVTANAFEMVEYVGPVSSSDLIALGLDVPDDPLRSYKASIFMIDDVPVKGELDPMEDAQSPDFHVWSLSRDDGSLMGGRGVPRLMRTSGLIANALWRMMMDNAALSTRPQVIIDLARVNPADKDWRISSGKIWCDEDSNAAGPGKGGEGIRFVDIPCHLETMIPLFNLAVRMADEESALPLIAQGDQAAHITKTKGGMSMLMDAAGVVLRRSVRNWDDNMTKPMIQGFYDWNMLHNPDESLKGDYTVSARGASAQLERQQAMESFMQALQLLRADEVWKHLIDDDAALRTMVRLINVRRSELLVSEEEAAAILAKIKNTPPQQPPDPRVQAAQINAKAAIQRAQIGANATVQVAGIQKSLGDADIQIRIHELAQAAQLEPIKLTALMNQHAEELGLKRMALDSENQRFNTELHFHKSTGEAV